VSRSSTRSTPSGHGERNRVVRSFRDRGIAVFRNGQVAVENLSELLRVATPLMDTYERTIGQ
jgi:hypothetical protein